LCKKVFPGQHPSCEHILEALRLFVVDRIKADLADAKIPYVDDSGRYFVFILYVVNVQVCWLQAVCIQKKNRCHHLTPVQIRMGDAGFEPATG
jgi:UDP-3-O-acyl-N-acetylglucosamine deacetylase